MTERSKSGNARAESLNRLIYERQATLCKAFAHPARLHILDLLGGTPCSAQELQRRLHITKANLSQHMRILRTAGVVVSERQNRRLYYYLAFPQVKEACSLIHEVLHRQGQISLRISREKRPFSATEE